MRIIKSLIVFLVVLPMTFAVQSQSSFDLSTEAVIERLRHGVYTLSSEEMEGREAGTEGERRAAAWLKEQMMEIGLEPVFDGSYFQEFDFSGELSFGEENFLVINDTGFELHTDFFVLPNSASASVFGRGVYVGFGMETEQFNDYEGLEDVDASIFFMEYFMPGHLDDGSNSLSLEQMQQKIETARQKGAEAVVFVNTQVDRSNPSTSLRQRLGREDIPVIFARSEVLEYWQQNASDSEIHLSAHLTRETFTAVNVAGYIDNNADYTVVIGGHYDHLGYGGRGSRSPGVHTIHYGADDNASGTVGVLEAARFLMQSDLTSSNYLFIGFSAEEKGLIGSRYFTESGAYDMERVNYMFNYDMIGRKTEGSFILYGTGTSPVWDHFIDLNAGDDLNVRKGPSGVGGSDHTSFYRQNIPVLFFFTGIHDDYHRPTDTPDKVNFEGMYTILSFSYDLIASLDGLGKLEFTETPVQRRGTARRSGPTLGIMPDLVFDGQGLRIEAVTENNPAQKAGMKNGDIIIRLGEVRISDINTYMQALGSLEGAETVSVTVMREGEEMVLEVNF